jgi:hypothetical protein
MRGYHIFICAIATARSKLQIIGLLYSAVEDGCNPCDTVCAMISSCVGGLKSYGLVFYFSILGDQHTSLMSILHGELSC